MVGPRRITAHDQNIGRRVRVRRLEKGLSQTELGNRIGVTFQQVQKYESGANRISAFRLQRIAELLNVPIAFFFESARTASGDEPLAYLQKEGSLRLVRAYAEIASSEVRRALIDIAEHLARASKAVKQRRVRAAT
jgi:transcriptional regulator with XRE-family HTH domain